MNENLKGLSVLVAVVLLIGGLSPVITEISQGTSNYTLVQQKWKRL